MRLPTHGGLFVWEFEGDGREVNVRVGGQLVFNALRPRLDSALQGLGLAYLPEDVVAPYVASGALVSVLDDWRPTFPGYHLYYPSRRHASPAFSLLVEALRYRER
jgi:DNA-binding transcriptional LysR family regulator